MVEVIEHLNLDRLASFERVLFEKATPRFVLLTTPNAEYNVHYEHLGEGNLRHGDHRFEWTRKEFETWAGGVAERYGYKVEFEGIGEDDPVTGPSAQMAVFEKLCFEAPV